MNIFKKLLGGGKPKESTNEAKEAKTRLFMMIGKELANEKKNLTEKDFDDLCGSTAKYVETAGNAISDLGPERFRMLLEVFGQEITDEADN